MKKYISTEEGNAQLDSWNSSKLHLEDDWVQRICKQPFCLLYKHTDNVFDDFPKISGHFTNICQNFLKIVQRPQERLGIFTENVRRLLEIRRLPMTFEEDPKTFRSHVNKFKYSTQFKGQKWYRSVKSIINIERCICQENTHVYMIRTDITVIKLQDKLFASVRFEQ